MPCALDVKINSMIAFKNTTRVKTMISILTDSTCDIPDELIAKYDIKVIPQYIIWGDQQYKDRVDLQPIDFYKRLTSGPLRPTSSQASHQDFIDAYQAAINAGADEIIMLTVSAAMSGTYQMAVTASKSVGVPVHVVDSKGPTMTLGWQVLAAARAKAAGKDLEGILEDIAQVRSSLVQLVAMESLEYLQHGGRIGDAVKWVGNVLKVKPLVSINHRSGRVEPVGLFRSHKALVEALYRKFFAQLSSHKALHIAVLHGNAPEKAETLAARIQAEFEPVELLINMTGPVLGINTGPGALALCGYGEG